MTRQNLVAFVSFVIAILLFSIFLTSPYLLSILIGGIFSILSQKPFLMLKSKSKLSNSITAFIIVLSSVVLVIVPLTVFVFISIQQLAIFVQSLLTDPSFSLTSYIDHLAHLKVVQSLIGDVESFKTQIQTLLQTSGKFLTSTVTGFLSDLPNLLLRLTLAILAYFFILRDASKLFFWINKINPFEIEIRKHISEAFQNATISSTWATLAAALAQSAVMLITFLILGVPAAFLAGAATFIFAWIPFIGSLPVCLAGAAYLYSKGQIIKLIFMLIFGIFAGIIDNIVRPAVLQGRGQMHPLVSLVAIFGGISMFGIIGAIIGPIVIEVALSVLEIWPSVMKRSRLNAKITKLAT